MTPTIVMMGNCGTGKSTVVEKMTGLTGLAGDSSKAVTKSQRRLMALGGHFEIVDTPGQNALDDTMEDNMQVAMALNQKPVSLLLMTTMASTRLEAVVEQVGKYMERFIDFSDIVCVMVTKMDNPEIKWTQADCTSAIQNEFGDDLKVLFSGTNKTAGALIADVRAQLVTTPMRFDIDADNFLQYFKICKSKMKIIKAIKNRVSKYQNDVQEFKKLLPNYPNTKHADLVFQFNTFMTAEIPTEQQRLAEEFGWDFTAPKNGETVEQQVGYVASMSSQMRAELFQVRTIVLNYQSDSLGQSNLRKCPHCGIVWGKWEGCDGATSCGARPQYSQEFRNGVFHGFSFSRSPNLTVRETAAAAQQGNNQGGKGVGCGQSITWSAMLPVAEGVNRSGDKWTVGELQGAGAQATGGITVSDVKSLQPRAQRSFQEIYETALKKVSACSSTLRTQVIAGGA